MDLQLEGKVGLVTGGSRGIGRTTALHLAAEGCSVGICGRTSETLDSAAEELRGLGVPVHSVLADVTLPGQVERFVDDCASKLGGIDLLVANVGGSSGGTLLEATMDDWKHTFDLNLFHAVRAIRSVVPYMKEQGGGSVVNVSSISGWKPGPRTQYGSAKAGEIFLGSALAWELAPHRVRVNSVSPGSTLFPGGGWENRRREDPDGFADFQQREFPWGRLGTADEIAQVIVFLSSPRASWINGANIPVDGAQGRPSMF